MGYPIDIDDLPLICLLEEIVRRQLQAAAGKCGYCGQPIATHTCKFNGREADYYTKNEVAEGQPVVINVEEVLALQKRLDEINSLPLKSIKWFYNGKELIAKPEQIENWRLCGLDNVHFLELFLLLPDKPCEECGKNKVTYQCPDCTVLMCDECAAKHNPVDKPRPCAG
jgi:hypothetical protein